MAVLTFLPYIQKDLSLTIVQTGWLASIFFFGYSIAQFIAGPLTDRVGPKKTMSIAIWVFTFVTGLTGFVRTFTQFFILRLGLAVGEGQHVSPSVRMISNWFPKYERARASGFFATSWTTAYILGPILTTQIAARFFHNAWRPIFFCWFFPGFLGIVLLWKLVFDTPKEGMEKGRVTKEEYELITTSDAAEIAQADKKYSPKVFLTDTSYWLYVTGHFFLMMMNWAVNVWLTTFLVRQHGFSLEKMAFFASMPFVCAYIANFVGGFASDSAFLRGRTRYFTCLCYFMVIPAFLLIGYAPKGQTSMLLWGLGLEGFFFNVPYAQLYAWPSLRWPKDVVGRLFGYSNGIGQFGAFLSPLIGAYLVVEHADKSYDFGRVFIFLAVLSGLTAICYALASEKPRDNIEKYELTKAPKVPAASAAAMTHA